MSIKIAIIDDGVSKKSVNNLSFNKEINEYMQVIENIYEPEIDSHGTKCALIIRKYAQKAILGSIKILDNDTKKGDVSKLISALHWCRENSINIINLSLGTVYAKDYDLIKKCIDKICEDKIILVAAICNSNIVTYPASFENVMGVCAHSELTNDQYFHNKKVDFIGVDFYASVKHDVKCSLEYGNSFATPLITAKVCNIMEQEKVYKFQEIKSILKDNSSEYIKYNKKNTYKNESPRIVLMLKNSYQLKIIQELCLLFMENDYNPFLISSFKIKGYTVPVVQIRRKIDESKVAYLQNSIYSNIIIIAISKEQFNNNFDCDLLFYDFNDLEECIINYEKKIRVDFDSCSIAHKLYNYSTTYLV